MSVMFYRNILNKEMKSFGKFSKKIAEKLGANIVYSANKSKCISELKKHNTIIFISHGSANEIFHRYYHGSETHQILVNRENINILDEKKVIAISCGTGKNLGKMACDESNCKVYLGFFNKIHFDKKNKQPTTKKYTIFVKDCYKDTFSSVLENAITNSWTFEKLKLVLEIELKKNVGTRALELGRKSPKLYQQIGIDQAILAVSNVAENICLYGDVKEKIC
jgi:hypothetical protein